MKWFLLILLTQTQGNLHEGFLWYNPSFDNKEQCINWVNNNPVAVLTTLNHYYPAWKIHDTLCVREDKLKTMNIQPYPDGNNI